jgi:type 1 fimbria pilin
VSTVLKLMAALAATAVVVPAAHAGTPSVASFKITVEGTQTSQASGTVDCEDDAHTIAPASASETVRFSTPRPKTMQFVRAAHRWDVVNFFSYRADRTTLYATGSVQTQSDFALASDRAPVCPDGGAPEPGCGTHQLKRIALLIQAGGPDVSIQATDVKPRLDACPVPAAFGFPALVGPDAGSDVHVKYRAHVPRSVLNTHKRVIVIHGVGKATGTTDEVDTKATGTSTLHFTMRLRRVHIHGT